MSVVNICHVDEFTVKHELVDKWQIIAVEWENW